MVDFANSVYELLVGAALFMAIAASLIKIIKASLASSRTLEG
jgi:hypothetical protein